jgi:hypothetical protein
MCIHEVMVVKVGILQQTVMKKLGKGRHLQMMTTMLSHGIS